MGAKFLLVELLGFLVTLLSLTLADVIECRFTENWLRRNPVKYRCAIKSITQNFEDQLTITGTHKAGKNDNDIRVITGHSMHGRNLTTFDSIFCKKNPDLEEIWFYYIVPASIDENALRDCTKLEKLTVNNADIGELPENFLPMTLKNLDLRHNKLTTLPERFFEDSKDLNELDLHDNQIDFLPPNIFKSLTSLRVLYLSNNDLQSLDPALFKNLENLENLYLNHNKISELPLDAFTFLINLKTLNLYHNQLTVIHADSFGTHNKLEVLDLDDNDMNEIDEKFIDILTESPALALVDARENECVDARIEDKNELKEKFSKCIENYEPRHDYPSEYPTFEIQNSPYCGEISRSEVMRRNTKRHSIPTNNLAGVLTDDLPEYEEVPEHSVSSAGSFYIERDLRPTFYIISYGWLAVLQKNDRSYFCGGTLITDRKVVTAAHCIHPKGEPRATKASEMKVLLGAYNLSDTSEENRKLMDVRSVHMHHYWRPDSPIYDYDIAVIVLSSSVRFDNFIFPLCQIPSHPSEIEKNSNLGLVIGYGYSEDTDGHEDIPKGLTVPMMTYHDCMEKYPSVAEFASPRTFCGGWANGTGACPGDSGNALMIKYEGIHYLRGIVSASEKSGDYMCGENKVSVYTDIMFFTPWINNIAV